MWCARAVVGYMYSRDIYAGVYFDSDDFEWTSCLCPRIYPAVVTSLAFVPQQPAGAHTWPPLLETSSKRTTDNRNFAISYWFDTFLLLLMSGEKWQNISIRVFFRANLLLQLLLLKSNILQHFLPCLSCWKMFLKQTILILHACHFWNPPSPRSFNFLKMSNPWQIKYPCLHAW